MNYIIKNKWQTLITVVLIFFSSTSFAVGFGKIKVYSYLNELLSAEIELIGVENIHTDLLLVNLASPKDFVRANMVRPFFLTKLSFEIIRHEEQTVIYVSSTTPVKNPFLNFLVELSLPDGKLVKGYTVLIDPPPKTTGLINRPQALKKRKTLVNETTKFDLPKSIERIGTSVEGKHTSAIIAPENKPTTIIPEVVHTLTSHEENIITDSAAVENALGDNIEINKPTKATGLLSGIALTLKANPLFASSMIDSKQLEGKNAADLTKVEQPPKNMTTLKDLLAQNNTDATDPTIVKTIPTGSNAFKGFDKTENVIKGTKVTTQQQNNTSDVANKILYKKYGMQLILSFLMVLISCFFIIKILRRSHIASVSEQEEENPIDLNEFNPGESNDLADIDKAIAEIKLHELYHYEAEKLDLSSNDLLSNNIELENTVDFELADHEFEEVNIELSSNNKSEIELKIKLAKQYIEAGDSISAKNIFDEVVDIAAPEQKNEIENILKTLIISAV